MTANNALDKYLDSLPKEERVKLVAQLCAKLFVTNDVFSNWRRSRTKIKVVYQREIADFIGKDIFADTVN